MTENLLPGQTQEVKFEGTDCCSRGRAHMVPDHEIPCAKRIYENSFLLVHLMVLALWYHASIFQRSEPGHGTIYISDLKIFPIFKYFDTTETRVTT